MSSGILNPEYTMCTGMSSKVTRALHVWYYKLHNILVTAVYMHLGCMGIGDDS